MRLLEVTLTLIRHPLVPTGCLIVAHKQPQKQATWIINRGMVLFETGRIEAYNGGVTNHIAILRKR